MIFHDHHDRRIGALITAGLKTSNIPPMITQSDCDSKIHYPKSPLLACEKVDSWHEVARSHSGPNIQLYSLDSLKVWKKTDTGLFPPLRSMCVRVSTCHIFWKWKLSVPWESLSEVVENPKFENRLPTATQNSPPKRCCQRVDKNHQVFVELPWAAQSQIHYARYVSSNWCATRTKELLKTRGVGSERGVLLLDVWWMIMGHCNGVT